MATQLQKTRFKLKDRVKFFRLHDKQHELTGTVVGIAEGDDDLLEIECDKDGKRVEVEGHVETAHAADVTPL